MMVVSGIVPSGHGFTIIVGGFTIIAAIASWVITGLAANSNTAAVIATMLNNALTLIFIVLLYYTSYLHVMILLYTIYI